MKLPVIAIVGRPNVGKSSLLNCLAGERVSIVESTPGVTRDRVSTVVFHDDTAFELIDTGGIGIPDREDLADHIDRQISIALEGSDMILFVLDGQTGIVPLDREVVTRLRESPELQKRERPLFVIVNKVDSSREEEGLGEFYALGMGDPISFSAAQSYGRVALLDRIARGLPPTDGPAPEPVMRLAVVGRQNVGKSTFVNAMAREERVIVSEIPGTTRDAIDVRFEKDGRPFVVIDTAGIQRKANKKNSVDFYSQARTETAIRRADIVLLMMDASAEISRVDKRIAETIERLSKPCVQIINKWDLSEGAIETERYAEYVHSRLPGLVYAPMVFTTAKDAKNTQSPIDISQHLFKKSTHRVGTGELNRVVSAIRSHHAPARSRSKVPKIYYATQVSTSPPTFVFFVNQPKLFSKNYRRYVENRLREAFPFDEVPLRVFFRERESIYKAPSSS